jgi:hypothetical protein
MLSRFWRTLVQFFAHQHVWQVTDHLSTALDCVGDPHLVVRYACQCGQEHHDTLKVRGVA